MRLVVDASITGSWCFDDERTPATDAVLLSLRAGEAFVPAIWPTEVANALHAGIRRKRLTLDAARAFLTLLSSMHITVQPPSHSLTELLSSAMSHGLTVYDATYLELAAEHNLPLATLDQQLGDAARKFGIQVLPA